MGSRNRFRGGECGGCYAPPHIPRLRLAASAAQQSIRKGCTLSYHPAKKCRFRRPIADRERAELSRRLFDQLGRKKVVFGMIYLGLCRGHHSTKKTATRQRSRRRLPMHAHFTKVAPTVAWCRRSIASMSRRMISSGACRGRGQYCAKRSKGDRAGVSDWCADHAQRAESIPGGRKSMNGSYLALRRAGRRDLTPMVWSRPTPKSM